MLNHLHALLHRQRKAYLSAIRLVGMILFVSLLGHVAQAQLYFNRTTGTPGYTPLGATATIVPRTSGTDDDGSYNNLALPFDFVFSGTTYNTVSVNTNGALFFTATAPTTYQLWITSNPGTAFVMAWAADLTVANGGVVKTDVLGTAPNRQFVVECSGFTRLSSAAIRRNFQFVLNEGTNIIQVKFGNGAAAALNEAMFAGLRGTAITDYLTFTAPATQATAWTTPNNAGTNTETMPYNTTANIDSGLVWTYTPVPPPTNNLRFFGSLDYPAGAVCDTTDVYGRIVYGNNGSNPMPIPTINYQVVNGSGAVINTGSLLGNRPLAPGERDTILVPAIGIQGVSQIRMVLPADDDTVNAHRLNININGSLRCNRMGWTTAQSISAFTPLANPTILSAPNEDNNIAAASRIINLPFTFQLDGQTFNRAFVSTNGYIRLGNNVLATQVTPFNAAGNSHVIAPLAMNLNTGANGTVGYEVTGVAPNRSITFQWNDMNFGGVGAAIDPTLRASFQLILNENGTMQFIYGTLDYQGTNTAINAQIGFRGSQTVAPLTRWIARRMIFPRENILDNTVPSSAIADVVPVRPGVSVTSGLTLTFTPPPPPPVELGAVSFLNTVTGAACFGNISNIRAVVANIGTTSLTPTGEFIVFNNTTNAEITRFAFTGRNIAPNTNDTINIPGFTVPTGVYRYVFLINNGGQADRNNDTIRVVQTLTQNCSRPNFAVSITNSPYAPINTTNIINDYTANADYDDNQVTPSHIVALPFNFRYDGQIFSSIFVSSNGYARLGGITSATETGPLSSAAMFNILSPLGSDQFSNRFYGEMMWDVQGAEPNRVFVVQWTNNSPWQDTTFRVNYQIRLYEGSNRIEYAYGPSVVNSNAARTANIGLNSGGNLRFIAFQLPAGSSSLSQLVEFRQVGPQVNYAPPITIPSGLLIQFTPPPPPANDLGVTGYGLPAVALCDSAVFTFPVVISNTGTQSASNPAARVRFRHPVLGNDFLNTLVTSSRTLLPGQTDTILAGPFMLPLRGTYLTVLSTAVPDQNVDNDSGFLNINVTNSCRNVPYRLTTTNEGYQSVANGTVVNPNQTDSDIFRVGLPAPFWVNNQLIDTVRVYSNGFIQFTGTNLAATSTTPISTAGLRTVVSAFASNLIVPAGGITTETQGTGANQRFVIQYSNARQATIAVGADTMLLNFQFILNYLDNSIDVRYGDCRFAPGTGPVATIAAQVGMRIQDTVFTNRMLMFGQPTQDNWTGLRPGWTSASTAQFSRLITIPNGFNHNWAPTNFTSANLEVTRIILTNPVSCSGDVAVISAVIRNAAAFPYSGNASVRAQLRQGATVISNGAPVITSYANLAPNALDTIELGQIPVTDAGSFQIGAVGTFDNDQNANDNFRFTAVTTRQSRPIVYADSIQCVGNRVVVRWPGEGATFFRNATSQTPIATDSLVISSIQRDSTFYVVPQGTVLVNAGYPANTGPLAYATGANWGLTMFPSRSVNLRRATVYAGAAGSITVALIDTTNGNTLQSQVFNVTPGQNDLQFSDWAMNAGGGYRLLITTFAGGATIHRDNPVPVGTLPLGGDFGRIYGFIAGNSTTAYYYFYNLQLGRGNCSLPNTITVRARPTGGQAATVTFAGDTILCPNEAVVLTANTGTDVPALYRWSNGATTRDINVTAAGSYSVQVSYPGGCFTQMSAPAIFTVGATIVPANRPRITAGGPTSICGTGTVTLTSSAPAGQINYRWSNGDTTASITVSQSGRYTVEIKRPAQICWTPSPDTITVNVGPAPAQPSISASGPLTLCPGQTVTLSAPAGNAYYRWSNGALTQSILVNTPGTFNVVVGSGPACTSPASSDVTVAIQATAPATPTVSVAGNTVACPGDAISVVLTSSSATDNLWSNGARTQSITVTDTGRFSVIVEGPGGACNSFASTPVVISRSTVATPSITNAGPATFCIGGSVALNGPAGASGYVWSNGATTRSITVNTAGAYTLRTITASGCTSSVSNAINVVVNALPDRPTIANSGGSSFCSDQSVTLSAPAGAAGYQWSNGATTQTITVNATGAYSVRVRNAEGCFSGYSDTLRLTALSTPAQPIITPSGPTTFCDGGSVTLTSGAPFGNLWSTGDTTRSVVVRQAANLTLRVRTGVCTSVVSSEVFVAVNPRPTAPSITLVQGNLVAVGATGATSYQWYRDGRVVAGQSTNTFTGQLITGRYNVVALQGACASDSSVSGFIVSVKGYITSEAFEVFPSPATTDLTLKASNLASADNLVVTILDATGKQVMTRTYAANNNRLEERINVATLPAGMYQILLTGKDVAYRQTFVKQ